MLNRPPHRPSGLAAGLAIALSLGLATLAVGQTSAPPAAPAAAAQAGALEERIAQQRIDLLALVLIVLAVIHSTRSHRVPHDTPSAAMPAPPVAAPRPR